PNKASRLVPKNTDPDDPKNCALSSFLSSFSCLCARRNALVKGVTFVTDTGAIATKRLTSRLRWDTGRNNIVEVVGSATKFPFNRTDLLGSNGQTIGTSTARYPSNPGLKRLP